MRHQGHNEQSARNGGRETAVANTWSRVRGASSVEQPLGSCLGDLLSGAPAAGGPNGKAQHGASGPDQPTMKLTTREVVGVVALALLGAAALIFSTWSVWLLAYAAEGL